MVLRNSGRVGSRRFLWSPFSRNTGGASSVLVVWEIYAIFVTDNYFIQRLKQI